MAFDEIGGSVRTNPSRREGGLTTNCNREVFLEGLDLHRLHFVVESDGIYPVNLDIVASWNLGDEIDN